MNFFDSSPVTRKTYPTLYARTSTGAIQVWWMEQEGNQFRSVSGQQDGIKTIAQWTTATAKNTGKINATSSEQQAVVEIQAKYDKQLKSNGYWSDIKDVDKDKFFQVMLAKSYGDYKEKLDWSKGIGVQIKYNGGRIVATKHGLFSRKGEKYVSIPHIEEGLEPFFNKFPDAVLDGEGFNYDLREKLNEIMKLLRKTVHVTKEDLEKSKDTIRFYIYDGFNLPLCKDGQPISQTAGYVERKSAIDNAFFAPCFIDRYKDVVGQVKTWIVYSEKELEELYKEFLKDKQEGAILRILDKPYENKRSKFLLKYKPIDTDEFRSISIQEGEGKFAGRVSTITYQRIDGGFYKDGTDTFDATFKGTDNDARDLWQSGKYKELINEIQTIQYNGTTGYGKPNYARLDWDNYLHDK